MFIKRRTFLAASLALAAGAAIPQTFSRAGDGPECVNQTNRLMVHEWGTFTVLQDESGKPIGGINTDDERLPNFVKDIAWLHKQAADELPPSYFMKGIAREHPDVYARLETPVTYFYPPANWDKDKSIDVTVSMRQGWLTQFYPNARPGGPDVNDEGRLRSGPIRDTANGSLTWRGLKLYGMEPGPETKEKTWLAPRQVRSASVHTPDGQQERYLFYRGVGKFHAPVNVSRAGNGDMLQLRTEWTLPSSATIDGLLLVDARPDGRCAFRTLDPVTAVYGDNSVKATFPATFSEGDYAKDNLPRVRAYLHKQLLKDGLLEEEANAMLNTWEVSYFKRPGLRLFYDVPRPWTEHMLPLSVSESADITRAMIGRIEIVTPQQRRTLAQIAAGPASDGKWANEERGIGRAKTLADATTKADEPEVAQAIAEGRRPALAGNKEVPADYLAYLSLGRFRNALVLDEVKRHPTAELEKFVKNYQLEAFNFAN
jgi:hypothetical protein